MSDPLPKPISVEQLDLRKLGSLPAGLLWTGVAGLLVGLAGAAGNLQAFAFAWLFAFMYAYTLCVGALFWILLHHATDSDWSVIVRRILENVAALFPWLLVLFVPVAVCAPEIYAWMKVPYGQNTALVEKFAYLNQPFFFARAAFYFASFILASLLLKKCSVAQDRTGDAGLTLRMRKLSYGFLVLLVICITFSAFDWLMALDYNWFSTMWGVYVFTGSALGAMALLILVSNGLRRRGYLREVMTVEHNHIMGKLLFAFIVFWGYIAFSQYFLIYYSNIPEETWFFMYRNSGAWHAFSIFFVVGHFFVPFLLTLTQPAKRNARRLCFAAAWVLFMHAVDLYWVIMPQKQINNLAVPFHPDPAMGFAPHPLDVIVPIALLALLAYLFLRALSQNALFPFRDARIVESIHLKN